MFEFLRRSSIVVISVILERENSTEINDNANFYLNEYFVMLNNAYEIYSFRI